MSGIKRKTDADHLKSYRLLINKRPEYAKTQNEAWCGVGWCRKVVIVELEASECSHCVQVFETEIGFKAKDPEMDKGIDIRQIADGFFVLIKKAPDKRRVVIGLIRRMVACFNTHCDIQFTEA